MEPQHPTLALEETAVQELASHLRGTLLRPGDAGYEQARQVYNAMINKYPALIARGIAPTGTENYGGPLVTAGGLIFIGATADETFRAFDKETGKLLWQTKLPFGGNASPSTYMVNGRQFVVISAGGGKSGRPVAYLFWSIYDRQRRDLLPRRRFSRHGPPQLRRRFRPPPGVHRVGRAGRPFL